MSIPETVEVIGGMEVGEVVNTAFGPHRFMGIIDGIVQLEPIPDTIHSNARFTL